MTNTIINCFNVNDLTPFSFVAGTPQELTFDVNDSDGSAVDLSLTTCSVVFSPYGQYNYAILTVAGSQVIVSGSPVNRFVATTTNADTQYLEGKFTMQPVIVDAEGDEFRPSQGIVLILGRNATV